MARTKDSGPQSLNPEAWENRIIGKAYAMAERQIDEGTASSQVLTQFLKAGSAQARLERAKLEHETELLKARTETIDAQKQNEGFYQEVLTALGIYSGKQRDEENVDDDDEYYDY